MDPNTILRNTLEDVKRTEIGEAYLRKHMGKFENWYDSEKYLQKPKLTDKLFEVLTNYFTNPPKPKEPKQRKQRITRVHQSEQRENLEGDEEHHMLEANKNIRLRGVTLRTKNTRLNEIDDLVRNFTYMGHEDPQTIFQETFFPNDLLEKYNKQISGRTLSEKCSVTKNTSGTLNPNQESVYAIAKLRAEGKINTPGLLVKHGTGAGKTLIAVLVLLAFWNKRTTDGRLWTVMLVSTIQNQRHDNNIKKLADLCIEYFSNFKGYTDLTNDEQPIFSKEFYETNKEVVQAITNHQEFVVYILLKRITNGIYDTFIKNKKTETNEEVVDKITKYINRRTEENQLGLTYYGMLGYDLAMNTYTFDQFEFKKQTVETQKEYVETQKVLQKRYLPHVNYFFEDRQKKIESNKYIFRMSNVSQNSDGTFTGTFQNGVTKHNIPSEYVKHVGSEGRNTRYTKKIELYDSMYPDLIDTEHQDFSERVVELNNEIQRIQMDLENLEREKKNTKEYTSREMVLIKEIKQKEKDLRRKEEEFDAYIKNVYRSLIDFFNILIDLGVFGDVTNVTKFINSLLPLYHTVLINVFNIKFESGHYYLMNMDFDLEKLVDESDEPSDETLGGIEDLQTGTDEEKQREELQEDLTNEPYIQMNEYRKIQNCVFIFDEIQLLFDVPSSESMFRHKYKQLIHFMKYYRDPETTWLVGLTATPGSTTKDVADLMSMITTIPDVVVPKDPSKIDEPLRQEIKSVANKQFKFTRSGVYDNQMYIADVDNNVVLRQGNPFPNETDELAEYIKRHCKLLVSYVDFTSDYSSYPRVSFKKICVPFDVIEEEDFDEPVTQQHQQQEYVVVEEDRGEGKRKRRLKVFNNNDDNTEKYSPKSSEAFEAGVDSYVDVMKKYEIERKILHRLRNYETETGDIKQARNMFIQMNGFYGIAEYLHTFIDGNKKLEYYPYDNQNKLDLPVIKKTNENKGESLEFNKLIRVSKKEIYTTLVRAGLYLNVPKNHNTTSFGNKINMKPFTFNSRKETGVKKIMIPSNKTKTVVSNILNALFEKNGNFKSNTGKHYVYCSDTIGLNLIAYLLMKYSGGKLFPFGTDVQPTNHFGTPTNAATTTNAVTNATGKQNSPEKKKEEKEKVTLIEPNDEYRYFFVLDSKSTSRLPLSEAYVALPSEKHREGKAIAGSKIKNTRGEIVNLHGEIIPIILATGESYKGVDMSAITHIHVVDAFLDFQNFLQLVGRGPRMCSHALLPALKRRVEIIMYHNESTKIECDTILRNSDVCNGGFELSSDYLLWNRSIHDYQEIWGKLNEAFTDVAFDRKVFETTFHKDKNQQFQTISTLTCFSEEQQQEKQIKQQEKTTSPRKNKINDLQEFVESLKIYKNLNKYFDLDSTLYKIEKKGHKFLVLLKIPVKQGQEKYKLPFTFGYETSFSKRDVKAFFKNFDLIIQNIDKGYNYNVNPPEYFEEYKKQRKEMNQKYNEIKILMKKSEEEIITPKDKLRQEQEFGRHSRLRHRRRH